MTVCSRELCVASAVAALFLASAPASAQLLAEKTLSLAQALTVATTAIETCKAQGYRVSATVVGLNGEVRVQLRGDNTSPHTAENSFRKAYTSRTFRISSADFVKRVQANPTSGQVHLTNVVASAGALPIKVGEETIGAIGVSGAPGGEKDEVCAKAGIDKIADQLK